MFKNMKIGVKLFMGFGVMVILFGVIGFVSWSRMSVVKDQALALSAEYVPEVLMASNIERSTAKARYEIKTFSLTRNDQYFQSGQSYLEETRKYLEEAKTHADKYTDLLRLRENTPKAIETLNEYKTLLESTHIYVTQLNHALDEAGDAAEVYMNLCQDFLTNQNEQMRIEIRSEALRSKLEERLYKITLTNDIIDLGNNTRINTIMAILNQNTQTLQESSMLLETANKKLEELLSTTKDSQRLLQLETIKKNALVYREKIDIFSNNLTQLNDVMTELGEKGTLLESLSGEVMNGGISETTNISKFTAEQINKTLKLLMIIIGIAAFIGVVVAYLITRMITRPLKTVVDLSERAGSGDLTIAREDFNYEGSDELAQMADSLSNMVKAQRTAVREIIEEVQKNVDNAQSLFALSEETNASVEEVKGAVEQVARMSEENSAALEQTNAGVQEVSTSATNSAQASSEGASAAAKTIEVAGGAVGDVNTVIDNIVVIGEKSKDVDESVSELSASVNTISGFVETITGIADQTNLLALNAAIEAARAGDAGMGFAVVADEVRKLAEGSSKAANEVRTLIEILQKGAQDAMTVTRETGSIVEKTVENAREAQKKLEGGLTEINKITDLMQNIAAGAQEQAAAAEEMAAGVDQVTGATNQIVETVANIRENSEETAKASENVAQHAQELTEGSNRIQEKLAQFRVERDSFHSVSPATNG